MQLRWSYKKCNFISKDGMPVTDFIQDKEGLFKSLFISKSRLVRFLEENDLILLWVMYGERMPQPPEHTRPHIRAYCFVDVEGYTKSRLRVYLDDKKIVETSS